MSWFRPSSQSFQSWLYTRPQLVDFLRRIKRGLGLGSAFNRRLQALLHPLGDFTFIQIGAHDGFTGDPFRTFILSTSGKGILVEPQSSLIPLLEQHYSRRPGISIVRAAVSYSGASTVTLYSSALATVFAPNHPSLLASTSEEHLTTYSHGGVSEEQVPAVTLEVLMSQQGLKTVDCLFLDVEGAEADILLGMDSDKLCPKLICFEWVHIPKKLEQVSHHLRGMGFSLETFDADIIAWR
ncbi:MAG TPA: hypothetical protein DDZ88_22140 [Verrucomicrobiales bacterium]|nr:hypothetical protein [Verrucomicrobiales bacterium]